jgi:hypothetical protein
MNDGTGAAFGAAISAWADELGFADAAALRENITRAYRGDSAEMENDWAIAYSPSPSHPAQLPRPCTRACAKMQNAQRGCDGWALVRSPKHLTVRASAALPMCGSASRRLREFRTVARARHAASACCGCEPAAGLSQVMNGM